MSYAGIRSSFVHRAFACLTHGRKSENVFIEWTDAVYMPRIVDFHFLFIFFHLHADCVHVYDVQHRQMREIGALDFYFGCAAMTL